MIGATRKGTRRPAVVDGERLIRTTGSGHGSVRRLCAGDGHGQRRSMDVDER